MNPEIAERIRSQCLTLEKSIPQLIKKLSSMSPESGEDLEMATIVPNTIGSIDDIMSRMLVTLAYAKQITILKPKALFLIPKSSLITVEKHLENYSSSISAIGTALTNLNAWGLARIDVPAIHLIRKDNDAIAIKLGSQLTQIDAASDGLLSILHMLLYISGSNQTAPVNDFANTFRELLAEMQKTKDELSGMRKSAKTNRTQAENLLAGLTPDIEQIKDIHSSATKKNSEIIDKRKEAENLVEEIGSFHFQATELKALVDQFQSDFDEFKAKLDERNVSFDEGKRALSELVGKKSSELSVLFSETSSLKSNLQKISSDSEHVLGNATAAGLARKFREAGQRLRAPLFISHFVFYMSIFVMLVSLLIAFNAIPLLQNYVQLPSFQVPENANTADAILFLFGSLLTRIAILLPGLLLAGYASKWHRSLQRLSEEYMHKETVAASVPGFKEESGEKFNPYSPDRSQVW